MKFTKIIGTTLAALCVCSALSFGVFATENTEVDTKDPETETVTVL